MRAQIPPGFSLYLDVVRFLAAIVVLLHHTWPLLFPHFPLPWPGHSAVVVFFVLSGYVITHASRPELGLRLYAQHRMARILPVTIAAILLSFCIAPLVGTSPIPFAGPMGFSWPNALLNSVFLAQSWMDVAPPFNPPFWSLNYEVWYYIIFGAWVYCKNRLITAAAAFLAGPTILLLLPVWLLGVSLYKWMPTIDQRNAARIFIASACAGLLYFWFDVSVQIRESMKTIWPVAMSLTHGSGMFVGDFLFGLIVTTNFAAAASLELKVLSRIQAPVKYLSSFTFSAYVFHMPLAIFIWNGVGVHEVAPFYATLILSIFAFGQLTERQTKLYRYILQNWTPFRGKAPAAQTPQQTIGVPLALDALDAHANSEKI
jgi:peptidoglycan/LPS O-acetylase OafA/YrhL